MVIGVFPIAKLGTLLIKQISKPLATFVKNRAKNNQFFRTYICMPPAQIYNWCEVKAKMWVMDLGKPVKIPSLNEAMAIELGANLLGETVIFLIAAGILYGEYARQVRKEAAKEEARVDEIESLQYTIQELYFQAERQDTQIRELMRTILELQSQAVTKPWAKRSPDPPPKDSPPKDSPPGELSPLPPTPSRLASTTPHTSTRPTPLTPPFGFLPPRKDVPVPIGGGLIRRETPARPKPESSCPTPSEEEVHKEGVITTALAYLQINDIIGRTQDYSNTIRFS